MKQQVWYRWKSSFLLLPADTQIFYVLSVATAIYVRMTSQ